MFAFFGITLKYISIILKISFNMVLYVGKKEILCLCLILPFLTKSDVMSIVGIKLTLMPTYECLFWLCSGGI